MENSMDVMERYGGYSNFVFIGEAGSGKSEVALNFAAQLRQSDTKPVHFFDMDMTKPLFRSRDKVEELTALGVEVHFQEQFMDTPVLVGGVLPLLKNDAVYTVLDVGGDQIGARSIGGFAGELAKESTAVFYVVNAFRPWSDTVRHIDETAGKILGIAHLPPEKLHWVNNSNQGTYTSADDFISGTQRLEELLSPFGSIAFSAAAGPLCAEAGAAGIPNQFPMQLYLTYPWETDDSDINE